MSRDGVACRACGDPAPEVFHTVERVPVHCCQLIATREDALRAPCGSLELAFCAGCGFIQNNAFDPERIDYGVSYEDTQACSPRFRSFAAGLAAGLAERHDLRGREVLEIGCGQGDFLRLLCEIAGCRGVGVDPAYDPGRQPGGEPAGVRFVRGFFPAAGADLPADLVCCRHTLEHLPEPGAFVERVRESLGGSRGTAVFFEVPDVARVLDEVAFWDFYYEHCSYFSLGSLARLFRARDFELLRLVKGFDGQYLLLEARAGGASPGAPLPQEDDRASLSRAVRRFRQELAAVVERWRERLTSARRRGERVVLWGAGSKAVGFLTTLGIAEEVDCVVDINPRKHGMFLAGTGHPVAAPDSLRERKPGLVIAMNPIYADEIRAEIGAMGLRARVEAL